MGVLERIWRLGRERVGKDGLSEAGLGKKAEQRLWLGYAG